MKTILLHVSIALMLMSGYMLPKEPPPSLVPDGGDITLYEVFMQPNGDLVVEGGGFDHSGVKYAVDSTVARITPDGETVWAYHLPYVSEMGVNGLLALSDGRFVKPHLVSESERTCAFYYFDAEKGFVGKSETMPLASFIPVEGYILCVDTTQEDIFRIQWMDLDANVVKETEYKVQDAEASYLQVAEGEDGYLMLTISFRDETTFRLTKIGPDGTMVWQKQYETPGYVNYFQPDGEGGAFLMHDPGLYSDTCTVMRVDRDGDLRWTKKLKLGDRVVRWDDLPGEGYQILTGDDTSLELVRYDMDGNMTRVVRAKPETGRPDTTYDPFGLTFAPDGTLYFYGKERTVDYSEYYESFFLPLSAFPMMDAQ